MPKFLNDLIAVQNERDDEDLDKENEEIEEEEEEEAEDLYIQAISEKLKAMQKLKAASTALLFAAGLISTNAIAQDSSTASLRAPSWYFGASVGKANADIGTGDINSGFSGSVDDRDTAWKVYGGGMFNPNLGVELGYVHLGTTSVRGNVGAVSTSMDSEAQGISLALVGEIPLSQFTSYGRGLALTGKVGIFRWQADDRQYTCSAGSCTTRGELRDTDPVFGVGVKYGFSRNMAVRLDYEQYHNVANANYNLWTVGLQAGF